MIRFRYRNSRSDIRLLMTVIFILALLDCSPKAKVLVPLTDKDMLHRTKVQTACWKLKIQEHRDWSDSATRPAGAEISQTPIERQTYDPDLLPDPVPMAMGKDRWKVTSPHWM